MHTLLWNSVIDLKRVAPTHFSRTQQYASNSNRLSSFFFKTAVVDIIKNKILNSLNADKTLHTNKKKIRFVMLHGFMNLIWEHCTQILTEFQRFRTNFKFCHNITNNKLDLNLNFILLFIYITKIHLCIMWIKLAFHE